jgi:hypothetical protein
MSGAGFVFEDAKVVTKKKAAIASLKSNKKSKSYRRFCIQNKTGLFKVELLTGEVIIWVSYYWGMGKIEELECILCGKEKDVQKLYTIIDKQRDRQKKPKVGVHYAYSDSAGIVHYDELDYPLTPVIHPICKDVAQHIDFYFNNVEKYCINNRAGNKNVLIYGEQGTGKSSLLYRIADKYKNTHSVVFCGDIVAVYKHCKLCAKYKVPTIIIFEDAEGALSDNNSAIKNFLSGVDTPRNIAGCYTIFTSNYPKKIEGTIIKRKGRIDRLFEMGKLGGKFLEKCIRLYFDPYVNDEYREEIYGYLMEKTLSGSKIMVLAEESLTSAAKDGISTIEPKHVKEMYATWVDEFEKLKNTKDDASDLDSGNKRKLGFATNASSMHMTAADDYFADVEAF